MKSKIVFKQLIKNQQEMLDNISWFEEKFKLNRKMFGFFWFKCNLVIDNIV